MDPKSYPYFLSIVVPVYNVEHYLRSCLISLVHQDLERNMYEIIIVNDGSPDQSLLLAQKYQKENPDNHIQVVDKENGGVSSARNVGLNKASGQYIMFVDGDDQLQKNVLGSIKEWVNQLGFQPDVVHFNIIDENDAETSDVKNLKNTEHSLNVNGPEYYLNHRHKGKARDTSCTSLFRKAFLNQYDLCYNEKAFFIEDGEFLAKVFSMAGPCAGNLFPVYLRSQRPDSATATASGIRTKLSVIQGVSESAFSLFRFKQKHNPVGLGETVLNQALIKFVSLTLQLCLNTNRFMEARNYMRKFKEEGISRLDTSGVTMNFPELGRAYNRGFAVFVFYHFVKKYRKRLHNLGKKINPKI